MTAPSPPPAPLALDALEPIASLRRRWPVLLGALLSLAMIAGLVHELFDHGFSGLSRAVPHSPWFYLFFLATYFALPVADLVIFRRLWRIPFSAFGALNRKRITNDVLIGYTGDAYFYAWARARLKMVAAPFGAVKDVSIVSGIAGNATTILLAAVALPLGWDLMQPGLRSTILWSLTIPLGVSAIVLVFSRRVFSLPRRQLLFIFWIDVLRLVFVGVTLALAWAAAMPSVAPGMWLFLVAGRQVVSRLPLLPNKDLLFANFAILVIGQDRTLSDLMAFTAGSTLLLHLLLIAGFGIAQGVERMTAWRRPH
ncbi:hypothetical protein ASG29_00340 [Sphingomonas sp. Leaf412]|uniref:hypothetical protein n=1 Tax=Sphingomonas sp. Leaf412 TaxID=1736370 RepID=UPI0006FC36CF|nr:hypothetical protein [Sphingomonas sp. Leaf412]KQT34660.1 hypothetical protein ASG29_00340 [Sphingomonas sp. Leaf412]